MSKDNQDQGPLIDIITAITYLDTTGKTSKNDVEPNMTSPEYSDYEKSKCDGAQGVQVG